MKTVIPILVLLSVVKCVLSARILAMLPMPGKSHFIFCQSVLSAVAARGHEVTVFSPFKPPKPVPNMKHIEIHTSFETVMKEMWTFDSFREMITTDHYFGNGAQLVWKISYSLCEEVLNNEKIKELILSKEKYDLVVTEALFGQESMLVFGHLFNAPTININGFGPWAVINRVHGNDLQIPYFPDVVSFSFTDQMDIIERFRNLVSTIWTLLSYHYVHLPIHQAIIDRALKQPGIPPVADMVTNVSLTLANFHPSLGYPRSVPTNIVPVGGIHIAQDIAPLPKDVKDFMDRGKNSVIYFSLGTVVPAHLMPEYYIQTFVNVFKRLPYRVLWKIEADNVANLPSNVMISKWLPQQSVLAHPNCVLFITHGGLLSQFEAFHAGVPVVGIPFFGDQPFNIRLYEYLGTGVRLDFLTLSEETMYQAITSVIGKPKFVENAKKVSRLYKHRAMAPADTAVFWVEYLLQHGASHHLRPAAALMPWYQISLMDIVAALALVLIASIVLLKMIFYSLCRRKNTDTASTKKDTVTNKKKKN